MNLFGYELNLQRRGSRTSKVPASRAAAVMSSSRRTTATPTGDARPTYAPAYGNFGLLPRKLEFQLLRQFYVQIPLMGKAIEVLSGFVGCPNPVIDGDPTSPATLELQAWVKNVYYGQIGRGLKAFLADHLSQTLLWGYGIGEPVANLARNDVERIWSYTSPSFGFRSDPEGAITCVQTQSLKGQVSLDPDLTLLTVYRPEGCDPNGTSLFFSSGTFCQIWLDCANAFRAACRRQGVPIFHIHTSLPPDINDPKGVLSQQIVAANEAAWNEGMRSQVEDGMAQDFFTCSVGQSEVSIIGGDAALIDLQAHKRPIVEEILTATGLPPFMLGLTWSTTERMSTQQADLLLTFIDTLRDLIEPGIRKLIDLRQRLHGDKLGLRSYEMGWCDVTLQDYVQTAQAAQADAQALNLREQVAKKLWTNGVFDQPGYAEFVTGDETVSTPMDAPPAPPAPPAAPGATPVGGTHPQPGQRSISLPGDTAALARFLGEIEHEGPLGLGEGEKGQERALKALLDTVRSESEADYPTLAHCNGNGKHD